MIDNSFDIFSQIKIASAFALGIVLNFSCFERGVTIHGHVLFFGQCANSHQTSPH